jgi:hypothetical protein
VISETRSEVATTASRRGWPSSIDRDARATLLPVVERQAHVSETHQSGHIHVCNTRVVANHETRAERSRNGRRDESRDEHINAHALDAHEKVGCIAIAVVEQSRATIDARRIIDPPPNDARSRPTSASASMRLPS